MSEPGTDIRMCIGFKNSISGLTKKSILTSLVQQVVRKRIPEQMCLEDATKCGQWFCWCHVFREVWSWTWSCLWCGMNLRVVLRVLWEGGLACNVEWTWGWSCVCCGRVVLHVMWNELEGGPVCAVGGWSCLWCGRNLRVILRVLWDGGLACDVEWTWGWSCLCCGCY